MTTETNERAVLTRRTILAGAGAIGASLVAAACGQTKNITTTGAPSPANVPAGPAPVPAQAPAAPAAVPVIAKAPSADDVTIAQLAAGLEVLAVGTYKAALDAAGAGKLGTVPAAVGEFVTTAMNQHMAHLDAWNKVLTSNGAAAVTEPNATLKPTVDATFAGVKDVGGAAVLALMLEQIAAATYLSAQSVLTDKDAIKLAGSIQIIDAQHVAILLYVLGNYPVPDTFAQIKLAVKPGQAPAAVPPATTGGAVVTMSPTQ
jgi:Ferritin-like domain